MLGQEDVNAILLDVHLGDDDGVELARALRVDHPKIGIAFFSGSIQGLEPRVADLDGDFLSKPFNLAELTETVSRLVRR